MRKNLLLRCCLLYLLIWPCSALADEQKLVQAIERGQITKAFLDTLTEEDVPAKWRSRVEEEREDGSITRSFFRGEKKTLRVIWSEKWEGDMKDLFKGTILDGEKRISSFIYLSESTNITPADAEAGYDQFVSISKDGKVTIVITHENGFFEGVVVKGRESHLIDDLEYTKEAVTLEQTVKPLLNAIEEQMNAPAEEAK